MENNGSLERTVESLLLASSNAQPDDQKTNIDNRESDGTTAKPAPSSVWYDDSRLRNQSFQRRKQEAKEIARAAYIRKYGPL